MTSSTHPITAAARENARRNNGQFGEQPKQDPGQAALDVEAASEVSIFDVKCGDTIWVEGNPVIVKDWVQPNPWHVHVNDTAGGQHTFELDAAVFRSKAPVASFDGIDWTDAPDFDDWESDSGQVETAVRYNADGYGQVSAQLTGVGDYRFHAAYYLGVLAGFDPDETLPDGRTKGEALDQWITDEVMNAVDDGIRERYGWDVISGDDASSDVQPLVWATNTAPGDIDADTAAELLWPAQARFINESDPGTFNADYPYHRWIDHAVKARQAAGEPGLPW